mmetsp:Transcript_53587/g.87320  ORF Transcript_53587/g.87320 Transcript_53587/m.87320 type:complete len:228 (+) Transcript_53587:407-1090(+)
MGSASALRGEDAFHQQVLEEPDGVGETTQLIPRGTELFHLLQLRGGRLEGLSLLGSELRHHLLHGTGLGLAPRLAQQLLRALVLADVRGVVAEEELVELQNHKLLKAFAGDLAILLGVEGLGLQQLGRGLLQEALDPPRGRQPRQIRREVVDEVPDLVDHRLRRRMFEPLHEVRIAIPRFPRHQRGFRALLLALHRVAGAGAGGGAGLVARGLAVGHGDEGNGWGMG